MRKMQHDYRLPVGRLSASDEDAVGAKTHAEQTHRQTILMPNAIIDVLRRIAHDEGRSLQSIFRESLDLFLEDRRELPFNEIVEKAAFREKVSR